MLSFLSNRMKIIMGLCRFFSATVSNLSLQLPHLHFNALKEMMLSKVAKMTYDENLLPHLNRMKIIMGLCRFSQEQCSTEYLSDDENPSLLLPHLNAIQWRRSYSRSSRNDLCIAGQRFYNSSYLYRQPKYQPWWTPKYECRVSLQSRTLWCHWELRVVI